MAQDEDVEVSDVLDRVKTGVNAFDELVMGGLPRGRTTVVGELQAAARRSSPRNFSPMALPIRRKRCSGDV